MSVSRALAAVLLACAACSAPLAAQGIEDPRLDSLVLAGIHATYALDFPAAEAAFNRVARAEPRGPAGPFFLAMIDWWRILLDPDDATHDAAFFRRLDRVVGLCDAVLDRDDRNVGALFFKGGAIGFRGRLYAMRKAWVKAAGEGKDALPIVNDVAALAPRNADVELGTGIYNYYAAVLPDLYPVLKPVMLFLPAGDRAMGLRQLADAAARARYANWEAAYFLVQAYAAFERKPALALPYARRLADEFPANPVFRRALGRLYVKLGRWPDVARTFRDIADRCAAGAFGFGRSAEREAVYYLGYEAMTRRDLSVAMESFLRCDALSRELDTDGPSGFMVMANLRMGMVYDLRGQRTFATKQYDKVLDMDDFNGAHDLAKRYRREPYAVE